MLQPPTGRGRVAQAGPIRELLTWHLGVTGAAPRPAGDCGRLLAAASTSGAVGPKVRSWRQKALRAGLMWAHGFSDAVLRRPDYFFIEWRRLGLLSPWMILLAASLRARHARGDDLIF